MIVKKKVTVNTQIIVLFVAIVMWAALSISSKYFFTPMNIQNIMRQMAILGILAVAELLVIITGGIDLSVGSVVAFINIFMSIMLVNSGFPMPLIIIICLISSAIIGLGNGVMVFDLGLPPFIATLAMMTILRGITLLVSNGSNVFGLPRTIADFGSGIFWGIPSLFWFLIIVVVAIEFILRRTSFGRYTYALGSNKEAVRLSGVNIRLVTYGVYILATTLVGIAGMLETTRLWMGIPTTGTGYELDAIAMAVLGGASLMGAEGTPVGAFTGALVVTTIYNGAVLLGIDPFWQRIVVGIILVITVAIDQIRRRRKGE